jgi:adenylate cyclase
VGTPPRRPPQKPDSGPSARMPVAEPVFAPRTPDADGPEEDGRRPSGRLRERRLAAIAFLDVVGFSSIVEMDEEGTLERWGHMRDRVIQPRTIEHRGRIVERLGDGLLLEFRNAVDAMRWALDVQERLGASARVEPPLRVRIAIHVSDILVEDDRLFGDGVNIAARLQEYADPGGVAFSAVVHEQVRDVLRYEAIDLGPLQLKNIGRAVRAFAVPGVGPAEARSPAALPSHRPSIAVLPLRSLGPCPVEQYFAEGITHDIVASLAGFRELFVVSSTSTLGFAGEGAAAVTAGQSLGVRYVVNGTVSRRGDRLRITVELTDIETHSVVWTDRYDTSAADLFAAQDAAATRIAYSLIGYPARSLSM